VAKGACCRQPGLDALDNEFAFELGQPSKDREHQATVRCGRVDRGSFAGENQTAQAASLPYPPCNFSAVALIGTGLLRRPLGETITGRHTSGMGHSRSAQADSRASHVRCAQKAEVSGALAAARGSRRAQQDLEPFRLAEACGWGAMGYRASARAVIFERTDHRIDHAARQEIDGGFAAELVACAALDQPRAEAAMHRRHHRRAAGLGPY
jgi:hypothetical protein